VPSIAKAGPAAPGPSATRASARAKHARTVLGLAPPAPSSSPPPAAPGPAPNAYAVAVPATPLSPSAGPKEESSLPSVVLADQTPGASSGGVAAPRPAYPVEPSVSNDFDDELPLKRSSKAPLAIGLLIAIVGGVGAYALLAPTKKTPPPVST